MSSVNKVIGLFSTPFMRVEKFLNQAMLDALIARFQEDTNVENSASTLLTHTRMIDPKNDQLTAALNELLLPKIADFGELLFGERLSWTVKELWMNLLKTGGQQSMHNHANCFVSGILYMTNLDESSNTVFIRGISGRDFAFNNHHAQASLGPFNADKWIGPQPSAGDLVLFPSYLLHEVPVNKGGLRISIAFNAVPDRLNSWGYSTNFAP
jgi:uncharacterized protein (TIGR02466 family)